MKYVFVSLFAGYLSACSPPCSTGTVEVDGDCVASYPEIDCGEGTTEVNGDCVPSYEEIDCGEGTIEENGVCVPGYAEINCGPGTLLVEGECVPETTTECGYGTVLIGELCVPVDHVQGLLPFEEGMVVAVSQGHHGGFSHNGTSAYALDFPVDEGTLIVAMKAGIVRSTKEDSDSGCGSSECSSEANYVIIDHGDGSRAIYYHLQKDGALVDEGEIVGAGQAIGLSGNTGWSTGPHLHVSMKDFLGNSLPLIFDDIEENNGIPYPGGVYVSGNAESAAPSELDYSLCKSDTFDYRGVQLDSEIPCSVFDFDEDYSLIGEVFTGDRVQVAQYSSSQGHWVYTCHELDGQGGFDTSFSFGSADFGSDSYLMISPANPNCTTYQSWDRSIWVSLR
jgi:hypothetical protein